MNKEKSTPFISISWETPMDSFIRHVLRVNELAGEFAEIVNDDKKFHSKEGKIINDELLELEDIFLGKRPMLRRGKFLMGPGMTGKIDLPIPSLRFRLSNRSKR